MAFIPKYYYSGTLISIIMIIVPPVKRYWWPKIGPFDLNFQYKNTLSNDANLKHDINVILTFSSTKNN